jgi:hypothetical protein
MNTDYTPFRLSTIVEAVKLAELRILESKILGLNPSTTYETYDKAILERTINGILAELVIGRPFNKFYLPSTNTFHKQADVGQDIEVRSSTNPDSPLWIRDNDDPARRYVLVICDAMKGFIVRGWVYGYEATTDEWWFEPEGKEGEDKPRPAWRYRGALRPYKTLTALRPTDAKGEVEYRW